MSRPNLIIPQKIMKAAFWSLRDKIDAQIEAHLKFTRFRRPTPHKIKKIDTNQSQKIPYRILNFCDFRRFVSQKIHFQKDSSILCIHIKNKQYSWVLNEYSFDWIQYYTHFCSTSKILKSRRILETPWFCKESLYCDTWLSESLVRHRTISFLLFLILTVIHPSKAYDE